MSARPSGTFLVAGVVIAFANALAALLNAAHEPYFALFNAFLAGVCFQIVTYRIIERRRQ